MLIWRFLIKLLVAILLLIIIKDKNNKSNNNKIIIIIIKNYLIKRMMIFMKMKALIQKIKIKVCNINYLNLFRLSQEKIKYLKKKKI